jgi:hypothetical protein
MLTVIFTTILMLSSSSVQATADQATFIGPPTSEREVQELDDEGIPPAGGEENVCLACD